MREITEGLYQVPSGQLFMAAGNYEGNYGQFYAGQVVIVPHTVGTPAAAMASLINRDGGSVLLSPLPGGCCVPPPAPPASPLYGSTPDGRAHGVEMWCIGDYASDYFTSARDGEYLVRWFASDNSDDMLALMQRDGAVIGPSLCGIGLVDPPPVGNDVCEEIQAFQAGVPDDDTSLVGSDCRVYNIMDLVQVGETTTTLAYNALTYELTYVDEDGGVTIIDLSALAGGGGGPDINVASVSYNPVTGDLTITETDASTYTVNVGTSPVSAINSIIGNGTPGTPIQLSGDLLAPGIGRYYGTNGAGTKGWYTFSPSVAYNNLTGELTVTVAGISSTPLDIQGDLLEDTFGVDLGYMLPL